METRSITAAILMLACAPLFAAESGVLAERAVSSAGAIHAIPDAAHRPDPKKHYRIVFGLTAGAQAPAAINPGLDRVARAVNLYRASGVPKRNLTVVAVVSGEATAAMLDSYHYREKFGVDNPNIRVIDELREAGVEVSVCGQAVVGQHYPLEWVSKLVTISLSALTTITTLQQQGFSYMPL